MITLHQLLFPQGTSEFFDGCWGHTFLHVTGSDKKFESLFSLPAFEALIRDFGAFLTYPRVTVYSDKGTVHESRFTMGSRVRISGALGYDEERRVDFNQVEQLLSRGATVKISEVDAFSAPIRVLATSLAKELREQIHVNLYYSAPGSQAFAAHFDKHDVFILQIGGWKNWEVWDYQERFPLPGMRKTRDGEFLKTPKHEFKLSTGNLLYVPRGMWHNAFTSDSYSLHLTIGIRCASGIDLMRWLAEQLLATEELRDNLPHANGTLADSFRIKLKEAVWMRLDSKSLLEDFYQDWAFREERRLVAPFDLKQENGIFSSLYGAEVAPKV